MGEQNGQHEHLYHPSSYEVDGGEPLGPFTCSVCGDIQLWLDPGTPLQADTLLPPAPLPTTRVLTEDLPDDLAAIPEKTRALAMQLYRDHGVRRASILTGIPRELIRDLAVFELRSYKQARVAMRREYLKELLLTQATTLLEQLDDAMSTTGKKELTAAAATLIDRLRLESGDPSVIQENRDTEDPLQVLQRELAAMAARTQPTPPVDPATPFPEDRLA